MLFPSCDSFKGPINANEMIMGVGEAAAILWSLRLSVFKGLLAAKERKAPESQAAKCHCATTQAVIVKLLPREHKAFQEPGAVPLGFEPPASNTTEPICQDITALQLALSFLCCDSQRRAGLVRATGLEISYPARHLGACGHTWQYLPITSQHYLFEIAFNSELVPYLVCFEIVP